MNQASSADDARAPAHLCVLERRLGEAVAALASELSAPLVLLALEPLLDALYARAAGDPAALRRLQSTLDTYSGRHPLIDAWYSIVELALAASAQREVLARLDCELPRLPEWSRLLVSVEAARLIWHSDGPARAWERVRKLRPVSTLGRVLPVHEVGAVRRDSPLLLSAVCVLLDLAAVNGEWEIHNQVAELASGFYRADEDAALRVTLAIADGALLRGRYVFVLQELAAQQARAREGLLVLLLTVRLQALVALGEDVAQIHAELCAWRNAYAAIASAEHGLGRDELQRCAERVRLLVRATPELQRMEDFALDDYAPDAQPELFEREQAARRIKHPEKRVRTMLDVLRDLEEAFSDPQAWRDPATSIRLRLSWCRLVVDLAQRQTFGACEAILAELLHEARQLRFEPLEMLLHDQRAVVRQRRQAPDVAGALLDASAAAQIAIKLLRENAEVDAEDQAYVRRLLERLMPVFDRVIEIHIDGPLQVARVHTELLSRPAGKLDARLLNQETPTGAWLRFGRVLHSYAEQAQVLALQEARRIRAGEQERFNGFALKLDETTRLSADELRAQLRPGDAVLQYLLVSRYLLVFFHARDYFDWWIYECAEESSERMVRSLVDRLREWTQGGSDTPGANALAADLSTLHALLLPGKLVALLRNTGTRHLRVVPHGALYRVPFARLKLSGIPLGQRYTMSLHPTGELAAHSAKGAARSLGNRWSLGHVAGPEAGAVREPIACFTQEHAALQDGLGAHAAASKLTLIDGVKQRQSEILARLPLFSLLHFTCHGLEGRALEQASVLLAFDASSGFSAKAISRLELESCELVVMQACSTGWMDHVRTRPVQGIPQAFCDAGVEAVIAPLTKVPFELAPLFSSVYYRALRFLPAEVALKRTLDVLRLYGRTLVASDPHRRERFEAHGANMDGFEYRYTGTTNIRVGSLMARWRGALSFWWFELGLKVATRKESI